MLAGSKQTKILLLLILPLFLLVGSSFGATMDPLLKGLVHDKAVGTETSLAYDSFLVVDSSLDPQDPIIGVILHTEGLGVDLSGIPGLRVGSSVGDFITARVPMSSLSLLEADPNIVHVEAARLLRPTLSLARANANVEAVWAGEPAYHGAGVLVGIIDSGIDWSHEDFQTAPNTTRLKYIWDQFATGTPPTGYDYGAEFSAAQINAGSISEEDFSGHGTHVSGIAVGNGRASAGLHSGVAPQADIIFVKAFDDDMGGFPEDKTIEAMSYLADKAEQLDQPMVVNMSLGGHVGAHDGSSAQEIIIDQLSDQGLVFCIAAGNEGEAYRHDSGPASGTDIVLNIPPYSNTSRDFVLLDIWVDGPTWPSVSVTYNGDTTGPAASGVRVDDITTHGTILIDNGTGGATPGGSKEIIIQLDDQNVSNPGSGDWTITLSGGSGTAHAWVGFSTMTVAFPNSDQTYSVGMPGTAESAITVAAHKTRQTWDSLDGNTYSFPPGSSWYQADIGDHAPFSSYGPARDGGEKPDISGPGLSIFAPYSSSTLPGAADSGLDVTGKYVISQGTSMASPFVCGVVALMLEKNPNLSPAQIKAALRGSAVNDAFTGAGWSPAFGAGKVDALAAVQAIPVLGPPPTGDVNGDDSTTVQDLVILANHIADPESYPLAAEDAAQGDVYPAAAGDGLLNASDLARIVGFILESDQPGYSAANREAIHFEVAEILWQDGRWWQPVRISGFGVTAGQFALNSEGAIWQPEDLVCDSGLQVSAGRVGSRLRVIFFDLDGGATAAGTTILIPLQRAGSEPLKAVSAGILMVDSIGEPLSVQKSVPGPAGYLRVAPNPAPGDMLVSFTRNGGRSYELAVFNLRGRRVRKIVSGPGTETSGQAVFDGRGDDGRMLPSGVYFVRLQSGDDIFSQKVVLTR